MSGKTAKERYEASQQQKRLARDPAVKGGQEEAKEYAFELAERAIHALERLVDLLAEEESRRRGTK